MKDRKSPQYPVLDLISSRWSPVIFDSKPVEQDKLRQLFEAARWAPSCYNDQPWSYVIGIKGNVGFDQILSTLAAFNQSWAQAAPVLGISIARTHFAHNDKPNKHAYHDVGLSMGSLILQAVDLDLCVHQMGGFDADKARQVLDIPQGHDPVAAFAIGYHGDGTSHDAKLVEREASPSPRKDQSEFVFANKFGLKL